MNDRIERPGAVAASHEVEDESLGDRVDFVTNALLKSYFSWAEADAIATTAVGVLGAAETVAVLSATLATVGAGVVFVLGGVALIQGSSLSEVKKTATTIDVLTSTPGLVAMGGARAFGYSTEQAVRIGEYANAIFSVYKLRQGATKEYENLREELSALHEFRELREFIHERFKEVRENDHSKDANEKDQPGTRKNDNIEKRSSYRAFKMIILGPDSKYGDNGSGANEKPGLGEIGEHQPDRYGDGQHDHNFGGHTDD